MSATPDLSVRTYEPADRAFLGWTLRASARRALQYDALRADPELDRKIERAAEVIDGRSQDRDWIVLVAAFRGERCGVLIVPQPGRSGGAELGVPGLPAERSGARVYVDPWYSQEGVHAALDEAADLARQASTVSRRGRRPEAPPEPSAPVGFPPQIAPELSA